MFEKYIPACLLMILAFSCSYGDQGQKFAPVKNFDLGQKPVGPGGSIQNAGRPSSWIKKALANKNDSFTPLLQKYVKADGGVRYREWSSETADRESLRSYVASLSEPAPTGNGESEAASVRLTRMINLYNSATLLLIIDRYVDTLGGENSPLPQMRSIRNIDSLDFAIWNQPIVLFEGKNVSLNDLESADSENISGERKSIRSFLDARIHFAVNCASKGCPKLLNQAFDNDFLNEQLDYVTYGYVNSGQQTQFLRASGAEPTVKHSEILNWYWADFELSGYKSVREFFSKWLDPMTGVDPAELEILQPGTKEFQWTLEAIEYDWTLNEAL